MDSGVRRWVLKPLSPLLQAADLRTIGSDSSSLFQHTVMSGHLGSPQPDQDSEVVEAVQVSVSQDGSSSEEWESRSPSSDGSLSGFYSFVEDPDSPEAGLNQAWMVSEQRHAQLATLKEGQGFTLQTYSGSRRPESLFREGDQDCRYRAEGVETSNSEHLELRQEIIRSQAPRKSPKSLSESKNKSISPDPLPEGIDKEQINFTVAREQFLKMEEEQLKYLLSPPRFSRTSLHLSTDPELFPFRTEDTNEKWKKNLNSTHVSKQRMEPQRIISPVSEELSSNLQNLIVCTEPQNLKKQISSSMYETPIEQEIRRGLQREESLRFSRGLQASNGPSEMIQIRRRQFSFPLTSSRPQNRSRVRFMLQREVQNERGGSKKSPIAEPLDNSRQQETKRQPLFLQDKQSTAEKLQSSSPSENSVSWHSITEPIGPRSKETRAPDFIQKEIQDVLEREKELRNLCRLEDKSLSFIAVEHRTWKPIQGLRPIQDLTPPPADCLTNQHTEDHKVHLKTEESRYAGIHPVDDINNQVVEATRVVRHKNQRALRWEAGMFANQENAADNQ